MYDYLAVYIPLLRAGERTGRRKALFRIPMAADCRDNRWLLEIRPELEPLRAPWPQAAYSAMPLDAAEWPLSPPAPRSVAAWRAQPWAAAGATPRCGPAPRCPPGRPPRTT